MIQESLRITLPRAIDFGNLTIGSRAYSLSLFAFGANMFTRVDVGEMIYTPTFVPVEVWTYVGNVETGQIGGSAGRLNIGTSFTLEEPLKLVLFNLSTDAELNLTIPFTGYMYRELSG